MTKNRVLIITALIEVVCIIVVFGIMYFLFDADLLKSIVFALILSLISGLSTYSYLVRAFGLDLHPFK